MHLPPGVPRPALRRARRALVTGLRIATAPIGSVVRVQTTEAAIALTFDDGPDPSVTPRLLRMLEAASAQATFFVLLTRVRRHGSLLNDILAAGHEIALHGPDHRRLTLLTSRTVFERTVAAKEELEDRIGKPIRWFRPPYGAQHPATYLAVRRAGLEVVLWGPSLWDWRDAPEEDRLRRALNGVEPGAIVLGHDGLASADDGEVNPTTPVLDRAAWAQRMLVEYADRGFSGHSLGQLVGRGRLIRRGHFAR